MRLNGTLWNVTLIAPTFEARCLFANGLQSGSSYRRLTLKTAPNRSPANGLGLLSSLMVPVASAAPWTDGWPARSRHPAGTRPDGNAA